MFRMVESLSTEDAGITTMVPLDKLLRSQDPCQALRVGPMVQSLCFHTAIIAAWQGVWGAIVILDELQRLRKREDSDATLTRNVV